LTFEASRRLTVAAMTTDQLAEPTPSPAETGSQAAAAPDDACGAGCGCSGSAVADTEALAAALEAGGLSDDAPIACTLSAAGMEAQLAAWRDLLTGVTDREPVDDGLRLTFAPATDATDVARLAAAEQGCCAFLRFALTIDGRGLGLEVRTREDAQEVLTALFGAAS
jgi:MerR family copper efflux transcriptional regulator